MSIQVIAFAFGGLLLFVGLLGGGFEVKELKVPRVGAGVRGMSTMLGAIFVCLGFSQPAAKSQQAARDTGRAEVHDSRGEDPVEFTLSDQLGEGGERAGDGSGGRQRHWESYR